MDTAKPYPFATVNPSTGALTLTPTPNATHATQMADAHRLGAFCWEIGGDRLAEVQVVHHDHRIMVIPIPRVGAVSLTLLSQIENGWNYKSTAPNCPLIAVDIIIELPGGIVLIERKNPPFGWALPGGFVDKGESLEQAACREAEEETSLIVSLVALLCVNSDPNRDPRGHVISVTYIATATGTPKAKDDAKNLQVYDPRNLPPTAFDHGTILAQYLAHRGL